MKSIVVHTLVFVLGAATLGGQVCWSRMSSAVVGGTFASWAITLSAAMVGLSAGALIAGRLSDRTNPRHLLLGTVMACALALVTVPWMIQAIGGLDGAPVLRRILVGMLLGGAHLPFGAILPEVVAWCGFRDQHLSFHGGWLYALGALGSMLGSILVGTTLAPRMALDHIGLAAAGVVAVLSVLILATPRAAPGPASVPDGEGGGTPGKPVILAFGIGFIGIGSEVVWMRILGFYWEAGTFSYALVTAGQIGGLFAGSCVGSLISRRSTRGMGGAATALCLAAVSLLVAGGFSGQAVRVYDQAGRVAFALFLVGVPAAFLGGAFVMLLDGLRGGRSPGRAIGILTGANSAGAAVGPLVLWSAAPWISWPTQLLAVFACLCSVFVLTLVPWRIGMRMATAFPLIVLSLAGLLIFPHRPPLEAYLLRPQPTPPDFGARVMPFASSGLTSTVAVTRDTATGTDILWIDRSYQGDTTPLGRQIPRALGKLPCDLLGRPPRRVLMIGMGTGMTLSGVLEGGPERVDIVELCPGVIGANRTVLEDINGGGLSRTSVRVIPGDGRTVLTDTEEPCDLIITDMVFPTALGAGNLFSRDFYAMARRRISDGGLFVHWIPCFQLSAEDFSSVCAAFLEVFPEGTLWIGHLGPRRLIMGLVGGTVSGKLPAAVSGRFALGPDPLKTLAGGAAPIRDADPRLEYRSSPYWNPGNYGKTNLDRVLYAMGSVTARKPGAVVRNAWIRYARARGLDLEGDTEGALKLYLEVVAETEAIPEAALFIEDLRYREHMERAREEALRGDRAAMVNSLRQAARHPYFPEAALRLADVMTFEPRTTPRDMLVEFERLAAKCPRSADAHIRVAMAARTMKDLERARRAFRRACELRPDRPPLYRTLQEELAPDR